MTHFVSGGQHIFFGTKGRFICGWLCLFGLIQELLYKIPTPKLKIPDKVDRVLRYVKYVILLVFVIGLPLLYRTDNGSGVPFFCKYICPLGAFYSLFQKVSLLKMHYDESSCVKCGECAKACKMNVDPVKNPNSAECIRCGDCVHTCPNSALRFGVKSKKTNKKEI